MGRTLLALLMTTAAVSLAGCNKSDGKENSASLSIDMNSAAEGGKVAIKIPGIDAKLNVPSALMDQGDFDIDGVKLFPKSKVTSFNVNVDSKTTGKQATDPVVRMAFAAPADLATVTNWYKIQFAAKSVAATETATGFSGKTEDGDTFTIALSSGAAGATNGVVAVVDAGK